MHIAMAFHSVDKPQVARWLQWAEELGGIGRHTLWLMPAKGQVADFRTTIPFRTIRDEYGTETDWALTNEPVRDAAGANTMIRQMAWHFYGLKDGPWMFCEPDAIPLREGWHDALEDEYRAAGKRFMGAIVPGRANDYPDHPTGNMIWPQDAILSQKLMLPTHATFGERTVELAFDVAAAEDILGPNFHNTRLIQHVFRGPKFEHADDLARLDPQAVVFHTDKDGGLIQLLRKRKNGVAERLNADTGKIGAGSGISDAGAGDPCREVTVPTVGSNPTFIQPRVHTYFRPCVDPEALAEQKRILAIWEKNWREHGWEPVILTEADAQKHPQFDKYEKAFRAMPTVSPKEYEMACWLRWVAMSQIGGVITDYDVLNNGWSWEDRLDCCEGRSFDTKTVLILSDNNPVPCVVIGSPEQYQAALDGFLGCSISKEKGRPHLSDQLAIQELDLPAVDICREFNAKGWKDAKLIHFSHAACGRKRSETMQAFVSDEGSFFVKDLLEVMSAHHKESDIGPRHNQRPIMDEIRERLEWVRDNSRGITRHHVHRELKKLGLLPRK